MLFSDTIKSGTNWSFSICPFFILEGGFYE